MAAPLTFWFDFTSTYSYLSGMRIQEAANAADVEVRYRPFLLGVVLRERGWERGPASFEVKVEYMWRDLERRAAKYGFPFRKPSQFPRNPVLADRVACLAAEEGWVAAFTRGCFAANMIEDRDIADATVVADIAEYCGQNGTAAVERAQQQWVKDLLKANTAAAIEAGIFGAPSFTVGDELFWGDDRLNDALEWAQNA